MKTSLVQTKIWLTAAIATINYKRVPVSMNTFVKSCRFSRLPIFTFAALVAGSLVGCGGGGGYGGGGGGGGTPAPYGLSYTSPQTYTVGVAIASLSPTLTGTVTSYSVSPALPAGLSLNTSTGVISGTPTTAAASATYTVTATNAGGSTTFPLVLSVSASAAVTGTAAAGAPIAGATVTLKDSTGATATAMTAADGSFSVTVNGLTPPFLLSVASAGTTYFSYASAVGTANLTPYTSVVLQSYYTAQGTSVATVFAGAITAGSFPNPQQLALLASSVNSVLLPYTVAAGVASPTQFNLFTSAFTANHTGLDKVLDRTAVVGTLLSFTVDNGSGTTAGPVSSSVGLSVTPASGTALASITIAATTTNATTGSTSSAQFSVPVGVGSTQQSDLASAESGALALLNSMANLVKTKSGSITTSDVSPLIDPVFLNDGNNAAAEAQNLTHGLNSFPATATITGSIFRVNHFDPVAGTIDATLDLSVTAGGVTTDNYLDEHDNVNSGAVLRKQANGSWAFYGHQTIASAGVNVHSQLFYDANNPAGNVGVVALVMQAQVTVPHGTLSTVVAQGPPNSLPDCAQTPAPLTKSSLTLALQPGLYDGNNDRFDVCPSGLEALTGSPPAAGTGYTLQLTSASTGTITPQAYTLNSSTTDHGDITQINSISRASFAAGNTVSSVVGTTATLTFTQPTTFPVLFSFLNGFCQNASEAAGGGGSGFGGGANLQSTATSGTIAIPALCDGAPTVRVGLSVSFVGFNGEQSLVTQNIHN